MILVLVKVHVFAKSPQIYHVHLSLRIPGRCAVSYMLSLSDNVTSLLPFVEPKNNREHDNKLAKSSVSSRYAAVLLLQLLQSESVGVVSLVPRPLPVFQCCTLKMLKNWEWPGDEARCGIILEIFMGFNSCYFVDYA